MKQRPAALIADIVDSRELSDRRSAQAAILDTFDRAHQIEGFTRRAWPTVGDEFQAVLPSVGAAVRATTVIRLALPDGVDLRFGIGRGAVWAVDSEGPTSIQDGPGWWSARRAIDETHRRQGSGSRYLRSWFADGSEPPDVTLEHLVNSHLLLRDMSISSMSPREKRLALGTLDGRTQAGLAAEEGISQSAVSQSLARSGAGALLGSYSLLEDVA